MGTKITWFLTQGATVASDATAKSFMAMLAFLPPNPNKCHFLQKMVIYSKLFMQNYAKLEIV